MVTASPPQRPLVQKANLPLITLLQAAAEGRDNLDPRLFDERAVGWALETGLGPLLYRTTRYTNGLTEPYYSWLVGADLTAQVIVGELLDALEEILQTASHLAKEITLLKGISICQTHYPSPHLRTMVDMDLLVSREVQPALESLLSGLGYRQQSDYPASFYEKFHHSMPFFHPRRHVWVEVHTALFPQWGRVGNDRVFSLAHIKSQIKPAEFRGKNTNHLSDELQIAYLPSHWAVNLKPTGGLLPVVDMIYLFKGRETAIDWEKILFWLKDSVAATHLYLMLTYLRRHDLITVPQEVIVRLAAIQKYLSGLNTAVLHALLDTYLVKGKPFDRIATQSNVAIIWDTLLLPRLPLRNLLSVPWYLLFPRDNPQRFNPLFQLGRIGSALGLRR
jgi:hypothetical protein